MMSMIDRAGLRVAPTLADFIDTDVLPGTGPTPGAFWEGVADIYARFAPVNALLVMRDDIQAKIDSWHRARAGQPVSHAEYQSFLRKIGYLMEEPAPFAISPKGVDDNVARVAGPQLALSREVDAGKVRRYRGHDEGDDRAAAQGDQADALPAGGDAHLRTLVCGVSFEPAPYRGDDGRARCVR